MSRNLSKTEIEENVTEEKNEAELRLDVLIPIYGVNKEQADELDKIVKKQNEEIKQWMRSFGIKTYQTDKYKVSYSVQKRETLNEPKFIEYLKENWEITCKRYDIVKTREYIDMDALENAIYNNAFGEYVAMFDKFRTVKEVQTLKLTRTKK